MFVDYVKCFVVSQMCKVNELTTRELKDLRESNMNHSALFKNYYDYCKM